MKITCAYISGLLVKERMGAAKGEAFVGSHVAQFLNIKPETIYNKTNIYTGYHMSYRNGLYFLCD